MDIGSILIIILIIGLMMVIVGFIGKILTGSEFFDKMLYIGIILAIIVYIVTVSHFYKTSNP